MTTAPRHTHTEYLELIDDEVDKYCEHIVDVMINHGDLGDNDSRARGAAAARDFSVRVRSSTFDNARLGVQATWTGRTLCALRTTFVLTHTWPSSCFHALRMLLRK